MMNGNLIARQAQWISTPELCTRTYWQTSTSASSTWSTESEEIYRCTQTPDSDDDVDEPSTSEWTMTEPTTEPWIDYTAEPTTTTTETVVVTPSSWWPPVETWTARSTTAELEPQYTDATSGCQADTAVDCDECNACSSSSSSRDCPRRPNRCSTSSSCEASTTTVSDLRTTTAPGQNFTQTINYTTTIPTTLLTTSDLTTTALTTMWTNYTILVPTTLLTTSSCPSCQPNGTSTLTVTFGNTTAESTTVVTLTATSTSSTSTELVTVTVTPPFANTTTTGLHRHRNGD